MQWNDSYAHTCTACQQIYSGKNKVPPCETCKPEYIEDNADVLKIFFLVRNQVIMGFESVIDINHLAIWELIDRFKIKNPVKVFEKIIFISRYWINKINNRSDI